MHSQSLSVPVGWSLETRNRGVVVAWSPVLMATAVTVAWSLAMMLVAHAPDAQPMALKADRDAVLARNGEYLSSVNALPLAPASRVDGWLPNEGFPSIDAPSTPPPDQPSSPASRPLRAKATPHHHARVGHHRDVCAAQRMRREDFYQHNHWRSWRCVR